MDETKLTHGSTASNVAMTLDDFDEVMDILNISYTMKPAIKFWLYDMLYKRFIELNGVTPYEVRLQREINKEMGTHVTSCGEPVDNCG